METHIYDRLQGINPGLGITLDQTKIPNNHYRVKIPLLPENNGSFFRIIQLYPVIPEDFVRDLNPKVYNGSIDKTS